MRIDHSGGMHASEEDQKRITAPFVICTLPLRLYFAQVELKCFQMVPSMEVSGKQNAFHSRSLYETLWRPPHSIPLYSTSTPPHSTSPLPIPPRPTPHHSIHSTPLHITSLHSTKCLSAVTCLVSACGYVTQSVRWHSVRQYLVFKHLEH